jgi:hypothetical protein
VLGDPAAVSDLGTLVGSQVVVSPSLTAGEVRTGTVTVVEVACPEA